MLTHTPSGLWAVVPLMLFALRSPCARPAPSPRAHAPRPRPAPRTRCPMPRQLIAPRAPKLSGCSSCPRSFGSTTRPRRTW